MLSRSWRRLATTYSLDLTNVKLPTLIFRPSKHSSNAAIVLTPNLHATDEYTSLLHYLSEASGYSFAVPSFFDNNVVPIEENMLHAFREAFFDAEAMPPMKQGICELVRWLSMESAASVVTVIGIDSGADVMIETTSDLIQAASDARCGLSLVAVEPVVPPSPMWMQRTATNGAGAFMLSSDRRVLSAYRAAADGLVNASLPSPIGVVALHGQRGVLETSSDSFNLDDASDTLVGLLHCLAGSASLADTPPTFDGSLSQARKAADESRFAAGMDRLHALRALRGDADWKAHASDARLRSPFFVDMFPPSKFNPKPLPHPLIPDAPVLQ